MKIQSVTCAILLALFSVVVAAGQTASAAKQAAPAPNSLQAVLASKPNIEIKYDEFDDQTDVSTRSLYAAPDLFFSVSAHYSGKIPQQVHDFHVNFIAGKGVWSSTEIIPSLKLIVDGKVLEIDSPFEYLTVSSIMGLPFTTYAGSLSIAELATIGYAKKVEAKFGFRQFTLAAGDLKALSDLLIAVAPVERQNLAQMRAPVDSKGYRHRQ